MVEAVADSTAADSLAVAAHVRTAAVQLVERIAAAVARIEVVDRIAPQRRAPPVVRDQEVIPIGQAPVRIDRQEAHRALPKVLATASGIPLGRRTRSVRAEA